MQETSRLDRALGWLVGAANAVSAAFVLLLMILVVADITGRYVFNSPVPMAYEFGSFMLVFIVFLALASTQRAGAHIRVEFVTLRLPPRARACLDILAYGLGILVYATILWRGFGWAWTSWLVGDYVAGLINIPRYPSQFVVPLGAAVLCLQFIADVARRLQDLKKQP